MKQNVFRTMTVITLLMVILIGWMWTGCTSTVKQRREGPVVSEPRGSGKYYYFDDVLVPGELKYKQNKSFIYETPRFKTGAMVFSKWWLDAGSLMDFFTYHMEKDNWKLLNSFKGKESILNFSKPDKTCTIRIIEKWYGTTEVEIRVGPLGEKKM
jgi:hypothetical protein